MHFISS